MKHGLAWKFLGNLNFAIEWFATKPQLKKLCLGLVCCNFVDAVEQTMHKRACFMSAQNGTNCVFMNGFAHVETIQSFPNFTRFKDAFRHVAR